MPKQFQKNQRLLTKADFQSVFDNATKINQRHLLLLFKKNLLSHGRLGIIVSKRVSKKAVTRNRIKRTIRESFRLWQERIKGFDIVIIARQQCDILDNKKLREGIELLWQKLIAC